MFRLFFFTLALCLTVHLSAQYGPYLTIAYATAEGAAEKAIHYPPGSFFEVEDARGRRVSLTAQDIEKYCAKRGEVILVHTTYTDAVSRYPAGETQPCVSTTDAAAAADGVRKYNDYGRA